MFMLPFMFDMFEFELPLDVLLLPMFEFDMFEFDMLLLCMFEFDMLLVPMFEFDMLLMPMFEFDMLLFVMFALVLAFSAGEQADQTPATVSKARRAKVLRIEFPPVPSKGSACWGAARSSRGRFRRSGFRHSSVSIVEVKVESLSDDADCCSWESST